MDILNLSGSGGGTPFRRPVFAIEFSAGGGVGGLLGAAMALVTGPAADPWADALIGLEIELAPAPAVDWAVLRVAAVDGAPELAIGDSGTISLGYGDSEARPVIGATIDGIGRAIDGSRRITAVSGAAALSRLRVNQGFEQQSAGDIVADLADQAGVETGTLESGADFPFLALDDRGNAWEHIAALALKSGYLACFTAEGKLHFGPWPDGQPVQTFNYGDDILALEVRDRTPAVAGVRMIGAGAAGSQGKDAWAWLLKDPAAATADAGDGTAPRLIADPALRSAEAARGSAEARARAAGLMASAGTLLVAGAPSVSPTGLIAVSGAPDSALDGSYLVRRVRHGYSKAGGFATRIDICRPVEADGGGGGLL